MAYVMESSPYCYMTPQSWLHVRAPVVMPVAGFAPKLRERSTILQVAVIISEGASVFCLQDSRVFTRALDSN